MAKKYVPEGAFLACDKGSSPSTLRVSNNAKTTIYDVPMATEMDFFPFFNLKPMGLCSSPAKWITGITCIPTVLNKWQKPKDGVKINGNRMILEDSYCDCIFGGKINIFFDRASAVGFGVGSGKMPSGYIKEGFDWLEQKTKEQRAARDKNAPEWMKNINGVTDWFDDLGSGLVEGAIDGVVGLGETIYQVAQDPVGTAEALGGMISDADKWLLEKENAAIDWATTEGNFGKAANEAWDWASNLDGQDLKNAANATVEGVKKTAKWVADNPRKIGTSAGQFIPDAVAVVYTAGASAALTAERIAAKKALELAARETAEKLARETAEKVTKEAGEALAKRSAAEVLEQLAKHEGGDIARVVTKNLLPKFKFTNPFTRNLKHDLDEFIRQLKGQEEGLNKLTVDDFLKNRDEYLKNGRSAEGSAAQMRFREQARADKVRELRNQNYSRSEANDLADKYMKDNAALHDPDQIAGGFGDNVTGMGDKRINSSLGSQWKNRINELDTNVRNAAEGMTEAERKSTYLDVHLYP